MVRKKIINIQKRTYGKDKNVKDLLRNDSINGKEKNHKYYEKHL